MIKNSTITTNVQTEKSSFSCIYFQFGPNSVFQQILDWDTQNRNTQKVQTLKTTKTFIRIHPRMTEKKNSEK